MLMLPSIPEPVAKRSLAKPVASVPPPSNDERAAVFRSRLLEPVLDASADRFRHAPGAPPRRLGGDGPLKALPLPLPAPILDDMPRSGEKPTSSSASTALSSSASSALESSKGFASMTSSKGFASMGSSKGFASDLSLATTSQHPVLANRRRPRIPRMAHRRMMLRQRSKFALTDGWYASASSSALLRPSPMDLAPPSPIEVSEAIYLRECTRKNAAIWRGTLDSEVDGRDDEYAELANHRMDCNRVGAQMARDQAISWREKKIQKQALVELKWKLENDGELSKPYALKPIADKTVDSSDRKAAEYGSGQLVSLSDAHGGMQAPTQREFSCARIPTPVEVSMQWRREQRAKRITGQVVDAGTDLDSSSDSESGLIHLSEVLARQKNSVLQKSKLRPQQSLQVRIRLIRTRRIRMVRERKALEFTQQPSEDTGPKSRKMKKTVQLELPTDVDDEMSKTLSGLLSLKHGFGGSGGARAEPQPRVKLTEKELETLQNVFTQFDLDESGSLDQAELNQCLAALGLKGKNQEERDVIRKCLAKVTDLDVLFDDFAYKIVPGVREKLAEVKSSHLRVLFRTCDADNSGSLSIMETLKILRLRGTFADEDLLIDVLKDSMPDVACKIRNMDGQLLLKKNVLSLEDFQKFMHLVEERNAYNTMQRANNIIAEENIAEADVEFWKGSMVDLFDTFERHADDDNGLPTMKTTATMRDVGLLPRNKQVRDALPAIILECQDSTDDFLAFHQFVSVLTKMRQEMASRLPKIFQKFDANASGGLSLSEAQAALHECGVRTHSNEETEEVQALIQEFDEDGSGEVDPEEFVGLAMFVSEKLDKVRREAERQLVTSLGFSLRQYEEFREMFMAFDQDMSETLEGNEVTQVLHALKRGSNKEDAHIFNDFGLMKVGVKVDFCTFLRIMKAFDDRENMRKLSAKLSMSMESLECYLNVWRWHMDPLEDDTMPREQFQAKLERVLQQHHPGGVEVLRKSELIVVPLQVDFERMIKVVMVVDPEGQLESLGRKSSAAK